MLIAVGLVQGPHASHVWLTQDTSIVVASRCRQRQCLLSRQDEVCTLDLSTGFSRPGCQFIRIYRNCVNCSGGFTLATMHASLRLVSQVVITSCRSKLYVRQTVWCSLCATPH